MKAVSIMGLMRGGKEKEIHAEAMRLYVFRLTRVMPPMLAMAFARVMPPMLAMAFAQVLGFTVAIEILNKK